MIKAWTNCHIQPYGVQRAEEILKNMEMGHILPNITCYNTLIDGYACQGDSRSAERILRHLLSGSLYKRPTPDIYTFNAVLKAFSRSVGKKSTHEDSLNSAQRSDSILSLLENLEQNGSIHADVITYNTVLRTLCNLRGDPTALEKALLLLQRMEDKGIIDRISYNIVVAAYANQIEDTLRGLRCASAQYTLTRSFNPTMLAEKAESFISRMETINHTQPDEITYNTLMKAWSKVGDVDRAELILQKMKKSDSNLSPTPMTYVSLLDAYAHSMNSRAHIKNVDVNVQRAKALLAEMETAFQSIPTIAYNAFLNILSKTHKMTEADSVLEEMETSSDASTRPDVLSYCTIINGWARSNHSDKAQKAYFILKRMLSRYEHGKTPENFNHGQLDQIRNAYNMSIMACAFTLKNLSLDQRLKAMGTAHEILLMMRASKWHHPTTLTYELLFQGYAVWLYDVYPESHKYSIAFNTLQLCVEDGLVSNLVIERFMNVTSQDFRQSTNHQGFILGNMDKIPPEWRRNIRKR